MIIDYLSLDGLTRFYENIQSQLNLKSNKADVAKTVMFGTSNSSVIYVKISDFGSWGTGTWYQKGFSMLITSRAGETIWLSLSSNDANTTAKAIRLMNTYSKITNVYYSASENAVYVKANAWCNNINVHILSNVNGDYVPTVAQVSALPDDFVEVKIVEFGIYGNSVIVGTNETALSFYGNANNPTYNGNNMALLTDLPTTESWTFTLEDGTQITKQVYVS